MRVSMSFLFFRFEYLIDFIKPFVIGQPPTEHLERRLSAFVWPYDVPLCGWTAFPFFYPFI